MNTVIEPNSWSFEHLSEIFWYCVKVAAGRANKETFENKSISNKRPNRYQTRKDTMLKNTFLLRERSSEVILLFFIFFVKIWDSPQIFRFLWFWPHFFTELMVYFSGTTFGFLVIFRIFPDFLQLHLWPYIFICFAYLIWWDNLFSGFFRFSRFSG